MANVNPREFSHRMQAKLAADKAEHDGRRMVVVNRHRFNQAFERAVEHNPDVPPEIFADIRASYRGSKDLQQDYNRIYHRIAAKYPEQGEKAMHALGYELRGEGIMTKGIKMVYDSNKGGIRPGGILGALAGFFTFMTITGGGGGGLMGLIGVALGTLAGAYWGNKAADKVTGWMAPAAPPPAPPAAKTPEAAPTPAPAKSAAPPYYEPPGETLSPEDTGVLPSPLTPRCPPSAPHCKRP